jgi:hypothetical protein
VVHDFIQSTYKVSVAIKARLGVGTYICRASVVVCSGHDNCLCGSEAWQCGWGGGRHLQT